MKKTFAYALLILTALYSCEEGKQEEPVLPETTPDEIYLNVSPHTLTFDETDASKNIITVSTNRNKQRYLHIHYRSSRRKDL